MNNEELVIIIPAYNEGPRIGSVLGVVSSYRENPRIVVIDDGSKDNTANIAKEYQVEVLRHKYNRGKGAALQTGINHASESKYWLFLDADLINLTHMHLDKLLCPIKERQDVGMTVGVFCEGKKKVDLAQRYFSILNGQRGFSGRFLSSLPDLSWTRFGVEIFLSRFASSMNVPVVKPELNRLTHFTKEEKFGFFRGFKYRLQMYRECLRTLYIWPRYTNKKIKSNAEGESYIDKKTQQT